MIAARKISDVIVKILICVRFVFVNVEFVGWKTRTDFNNYIIILFSAHLQMNTLTKLVSIAKLGEFYLQWRRKYRGYRYWGTLFFIVHVSTCTARW